MEENSHYGHGVVVHNSLITLPIELLVYICSFLSVRDVVKIRCVSKILRYVGETPSLWKTFIWSIYPPRESELLEHVLKMFGEHVRQFHFADVPPSRLEVMLKLCKNVTHLSLPMFTYYNELGKLEKIVCSMASLQILDIQGCSTGINIQKLFKLASNLKELSIYHRLRHHGSIFDYRSSDSSFEMSKWIEQWANLNYLPRKLNVVVGLCNPSGFLKDCLTVLKNKKLSKILDLPNIAWFNICLQKSTDFVSVVPYIQVRITDSSVTLPSVRSVSLGLDFPWKNLRYPRDHIFHLTQGSYHGKKVHRAWLNAIDGIGEYIDNSVTIASLTSVTFFAANIICSFLPEHLEWLSIACPNLQRLDLSNNPRCLSDLQGLRSVANNCRNLKYLNLQICEEDIDPHIYGFTLDKDELWEILCTMHLTQLSVVEWVFDSYSLQNENMFRNYLSLQALEVINQTARSSPPGFRSGYDLLPLSYFPSITSYKLGGRSIYDDYGLKQIFSCRYLRCLLLHFTFGENTLSLPLECQCTCLQELYIYGEKTVLAETFINALYSHGGLEHVVLHVKSLTVRSITSLIEYSPDLVTFEMALCPKSWMEVQLKHLIAHIRTRFYKTKLINGGLFSVQLYNRYGWLRNCLLEFHNKDPWFFDYIV